MTVLPQQYTLTCVKIGFDAYSYFLYFGATQVASATGCPSGGGCTGRQLLHSSNRTYAHSVTITWDTETISSGSFSQSTTGDHTYQCQLNANDDAFARRHNVTITGNEFEIDNEDIEMFLSVPGFTPSPLVNVTATTITVSWTPDPSDADGYVVNVTSDTDTEQRTRQLEGGSQNNITLEGLRGGTTYNITVRAYQQLLGPASSPISVQTLPGNATL